MPRKNGRLTQQELAFSHAIAETGDRRYARHVAGYKSDGSATQVLARPEVLAEIRKVQESRIVKDLLPLAVDALASILSDKAAPAGARVQAAKVVLERGLSGAASADDPTAHLTQDQLTAYAARMMRVIESGGAVPLPDRMMIDVTPGVTAESGSSVLD